MHSKTRDRVFNWWELEQRDFPWRRTRDPWAILVSEFMLQQTQAQRVVSKYEMFLHRYPDVHACSQSTLGEVIELWSGLGYNRRAKNLHTTAQLVVDSYGGTIPDSLMELRSLPGIGEYTARAVLSFAFDMNVAVVDVNVRRVLCRQAGEYLSNEECQNIADENLPLNDGWRWNQAMIELGATICTSRKVNCDTCPLQKTCAWSRNLQATDPSFNPKGASKKPQPFQGSDRQGRGRLVEKLRERNVISNEVGKIMGWPDDPTRCEKVLKGLIDEGLVAEKNKGEFSLPK